MSKNYNMKQCADHIKKVPHKKETVTSLIEPEAFNVFDPKTKSILPSNHVELKKSFYKNLQTLPEKFDTTVNVVYQVVYPDDLNLKPASGNQKSRGRPKKTRIKVEPPPSPQKPKIKVVSKTRSGREVKFPKYIENAFKKIEINDDLSPTSTDVKISDFVNYSEKQEDNNFELQNKILDQPDLLLKKRRIAAQYRCPKCQKAYLGRNKILEHLKKNPSHGPMHQNEEKNFEVWNYLVNVTQKCPSSERGQKFCQELSNLLHNLLLLTNALFKKLGSASNEVKIDKVLGNAIGLTPGSYYFDDNNLYKNVTVLKLMANNDFLHSIRSKADDNNLKSTILSSTNCTCGKRSSIDELFLKSMLISSEGENIVAKQGICNKSPKQSFDTTVKIHNDEVFDNKFTGDGFFASSDGTLQPSLLAISNYDIKNNSIDEPNAIHVSSNNLYKEKTSVSQVTNVIDINCKESTPVENFCKKADICEENDVAQKTFTGDEFFSSVNLANNFSVNDYEMKQPYESQTGLPDDINTDTTKPKPLSPKIKIQSNILICPPRFFQKSATCSKPSVSQYVNNRNVINAELMTDNSVLIPLPNLRHSVDELMLPVPSEPNIILDNSSSSDEVMNVDQFVNERFRKITESDLEVISGSSLNLELPSLDLFQFHTS